MVAAVGLLAPTPLISPMGRKRSLGAGRDREQVERPISAKADIAGAITGQRSAIKSGHSPAPTSGITLNEGLCAAARKWSGAICRKPTALPATASRCSGTARTTRSCRTIRRRTRRRTGVWRSGWVCEGRLDRPALRTGPKRRPPWMGGLFIQCDLTARSVVLWVPGALSASGRKRSIETGAFAREGGHPSRAKNVASGSTPQQPCPLLHPSLDPSHSLPDGSTARDVPHLLPLNDRLTAAGTWVGVHHRDADCFHSRCAEPSCSSQRQAGGNGRVGFA